LCQGRAGRCPALFIGWRTKAGLYCVKEGVSGFEAFCRLTSAATDSSPAVAAVGKTADRVDAGMVFRQLTPAATGFAPPSGRRPSGPVAPFAGQAGRYPLTGMDQAGALVSLKQMLGPEATLDRSRRIG